MGKVRTMPMRYNNGHQVATPIYKFQYTIERGRERKRDRVRENGREIDGERMRERERER